MSSDLFFRPVVFVARKRCRVQFWCSFMPQRPGDLLQPGDDPGKISCWYPCWITEAEPVMSPRSWFKSDYGDLDKNVTLRVIVEKSTLIVEDLILVWLKYTLYRSRFVLLFHLSTNRFTLSPDGVTAYCLISNHPKLKGCPSASRILLFLIP